MKWNLKKRFMSSDVISILITEKTLHHHPDSGKFSFGIGAFYLEALALRCLMRMSLNAATQPLP